MIQLHGPYKTIQLDLRINASAVDMQQFARAFLSEGLACRFSSRMIGKQVCGVKITRTLWNRFTRALVEAELITKQKGEQTVVKFTRPLYPILWGAKHPWRSSIEWRTFEMKWRGRYAIPQDWFLIPPKWQEAQPRPAA